MAVWQWACSNGWLPLTFGVTSTGTAISGSGAASNATLAWLGGGALAAGGGGMSTGNGLLALLRTVGWTIAGLMLTTSGGAGVYTNLKMMKRLKRPWTEEEGWNFN